MAYRFSQPWLSKLTGQERSSALEFSNLRKYLQGIDDGSIALFNLRALNATIDSVGGNIAMGGFKLTGLGAGTTNGDSLRYEQLIGLYLLLTGGTMSGAIAMGTNKITGIGNGTAAQDAAAFSQLKVVQKVTATTQTNMTTTSSTYQSTSLTLTITPTSASNKIIVWAGNASFYCTANGGVGEASIFRDSTDLGGSNGLAEIYFASTGNVITQINFPVMMVVEDAPATTSATVYTVKIKNAGSAATIGWGDSNNQWIVAMEVAA